jgi:pilus assembly protein CpaB
MASHSHRAPEPAKPAPPPLATVEVLVAKADLNRGDVIEAAQIGWQLWPAVSTNGNFIKKTIRPDAVNQFTGAIVRVPVSAGQPIYDPMVVFAKGSGFMAAILPKGMRAVSMLVTADTSAGGFILPEDHVDVVLTRHDRASEAATGQEKIVTDTILRNARVLAVDQTVEEKSGQKVIVGKTVTIEVTPPQAEILSRSIQEGKLSLSLRSLADSPSTAPESGEEHKEESVSINTVRFGVSNMTATTR